MPKKELTEEQVVAIHGDERSYAAIAREHGCPVSTVSRIKAGKIYLNYTGGPSDVRRGPGRIKRG